MKQISQTKQFGRDVKRMKKRGKVLAKLREVVSDLAQGKTLPPKHKDHTLVGKWKPSRDCHIEPDWLLIYTVEKDLLRLERTGSHSDLFRE